MRVINLWGGPSAGKSTTAAKLFALMKERGRSVELITEYARDLVYSEEFFKLEDQLMIFSKQHHKIWKLRGKVDYAIVDSPLPLSLIYAPSNMIYDYELFHKFVMSTFHKYDNANFLMEPLINTEWQMHGRIHDREQSDRISDSIRELLVCEHIDYRLLHPGDAEAVLATIT